MVRTSEAGISDDIGRFGPIEDIRRKSGQARKPRDQLALSAMGSRWIHSPKPTFQSFVSADSTT